MRVETEAEAAREASVRAGSGMEGDERRDWFGRARLRRVRFISYFMNCKSTVEARR